MKYRTHYFGLTETKGMSVGTTLKVYPAKLYQYWLNFCRLRVH